MTFDVLKFLRENRVENRHSGDNATLKACLYCGREHKMSISIQSGLFKCFSAHCNETGNAVKLVAKILGISFKKADLVVNGKRGPSRPGDELSRLKQDANFSSDRSTLLKAIILPRNYSEIDVRHREAVAYLEKRGLSLSVAKELEVLVDEEHHRVVFPVFHREEVVGFVARDITGESKMKVLNSKNNFRKDTLWNFDRVRAAKTGRVIICEGIFDSVKCGLDESVAVLGAKMTPEQIALIKELKPREIYICLDPDLRELMIETANLFLFTPNCKVFCVLPPIELDESGSVKDPGDRTVEEQANIIMNHSKSIEDLLPSEGGSLKKL